MMFAPRCEQAHAPNKSPRLPQAHSFSRRAHTRCSDRNPGRPPRLRQSRSTLDLSPTRSPAFDPFEASNAAMPAPPSLESNATRPLILLSVRLPAPAAPQARALAAERYHVRRYRRVQ
jgi:hypothetical protein